MFDEEEESEQERNTESDRDSDMKRTRAMKAAAKTVGVVGATATMMRLKRMTSKVFAALQHVAMRLTAARMMAMNMGIMKIEATKPQATSTAAMIQEERPPMAQLPTQAVTELQMPQLSSKTTVWLEGAQVMNMVIWCLVIMIRTAMSTGNLTRGMPRSTDSDYTLDCGAIRRQSLSLNAQCSYSHVWQQNAEFFR